MSNAFRPVRSPAIGISVLWAIVLASCTPQAPPGTPDSQQAPEGGARQSGRGETAMAFEITSTAFEEGKYIPKKYTGDGPDVSPPLAWTAPPEGTTSLALICDDPDAPMGTWVHWVLWGIPAEMRELGEALAKDAELPDGMRQGKTDFGTTGYGGPMPPRGTDHRYYFKLYALDAALTLAPGARKPDLETAMEGHILAKTQLMGRYTH